MKVSYTARMNGFLGAYGASETGDVFEPHVDGRISKAAELNVGKSTSDNIYRGMFMKHSMERIETFDAYSFLDLLSDSGGIIKGIQFVFAPIAVIFSSFAFDLGVLKLLFKSRSGYQDFSPIENQADPESKANKEGEQKAIYRRVKIGDWQFYRLWWRLNNPFVKLSALICSMGCLVGSSASRSEGGDREMPNGYKVKSRKQLKYQKDK